MVPGEAFGVPGLPAAVLRARRRRPGRGHHPAPEAASPEWSRAPPATSGPCPRRTCTCTSPGRCGTRRCSSWPSATASCCPTRWSRTGRRSCRRPTRRAGSASSGSTTWRGRCCAPRTTYAGWCARPPRTTSRDGGRVAGDPGRPERVRRPVRRDHRVHRPGARRRARRLARRPGSGIAVVIAANRTRHPLDARTLARLAAQYAGRGVVGFGLSNDERRGTHRATSRRPSRSPSGPGCCWSRTAASCSGPDERAALPRRAARRPARPRRPRRRRTPPCSTGSSTPGVALEVCPVSNVALGVYSDLTSVPLPDAARGRRHRRAGRRRPAAVRVPAGRPVRHDARRPRPRPTTTLAELARMSVRASRAPDDVEDGAARRRSTPGCRRRRRLPRCRHERRRPPGMDETQPITGGRAGTPAAEHEPSRPQPTPRPSRAPAAGLRRRPHAEPHGQPPPAPRSSRRTAQQPVRPQPSRRTGQPPTLRPAGRTASSRLRPPPTAHAVRATAPPAARPPVGDHRAGARHRRPGRHRASAAASRWCSRRSPGRSGASARARDRRDARASYGGREQGQRRHDHGHHRHHPAGARRCWSLVVVLLVIGVAGRRSARADDALSSGSRLRQSSQPTSTGSLTSRMPKRRSHAVADLAGQGQQVGGASRRRGWSARACAWSDRRDRSVAVALAEAGVLDQPGGAGLDRAVGLRPGRARPRARRPAARTGLVKNDPALQVSWSAASSTMPLPRRSAEHRLAHVGQRRPRARARRRGRGPARRTRTGAPRSPSRSWKVTSSTT